MMPILEEANSEWRIANSEQAIVRDRPAISSSFYSPFAIRYSPRALWRS